MVCIPPTTFFYCLWSSTATKHMAYYKFAQKICNGKSINVYNNGNMKRDFTYIDDIIAGIESAIENNYKFEIFN